MKIITLSSLLVLLYSYEVIGVKLPGPLVYVVTPSSIQRIDEGRSAPQPFYYHSWIKRMDSPPNTTTITTTTTVAPKKPMTPDLIFAEFESDRMKSIRKLLEKERIDKMQITTTTTTTSKPIFVPDEDDQEPHVDFAIPPQNDEVVTDEKDMTDYFALYNSMYNINSAPPVPVYVPTSTTTTAKTTTTSTTTTTPASIKNVENIWHVIDSQKQHEYTGQWDEVPIGPSTDNSDEQDSNSQSYDEKQHESEQDDEEPKIDNNFALPGFGTNPGIGGENESRAIRTEPNIRFPYVNLKPFQMKNLKKPLLHVLTNSKKGNNMYTNLDNFVEVKHPVRGEAHDVPERQPVDRYNPAQPYLPNDYGSQSKQSNQISKPTKTVANLVPPPLPPPPKNTDNDFPAPSTYEKFPPFAQPALDTAPPSAPSAAARPSIQPTSMESGDSDFGSDDDTPGMDLGYRYKPPVIPNFLPTLPPLQKPFRGYSYENPSMTSYDKPAEAPQSDTDFQGYNYDKPPTMPDKPDSTGYNYKKPVSVAPAPPQPSYGHHQIADYPELVFDKPHGGHGPKGGDDDSMGMAPPPMAGDQPGPPDDSGFPHDFPGDFKYHHDFDDHDYHHYHHHHPTTTTTTEMPRVNRFSYYYLGKKLYYLPLYFSVYFIVYVGALIIKAVLRHKIVYPNSWRPNDQAATFFAKRSVDSPWDSTENIHEITARVTRAIATASEKYMDSKKKS